VDVTWTNPRRITVIPFIHGKVTRDGKMSETDIYRIIERWLERHPEVKGRERDIRIDLTSFTLPQGIKTQLIRVSIVAGNEIDGYDAAQDADLYAYYVAEEESSAE
jgi:hypothetical protein